MKLRHHKADHTDNAAEQAEVEKFNLLLGGPGQSEFPPSYWANLIVRTNQRVDDVSSGKALSMSWAARVAIPGIGAILSFFIGLHYYGEDVLRENTLAHEVRGLATEELETLLGQIPAADAYAVVVSGESELATFSRSQISEYLVEAGKSSLLLESLSEQEAGEVLAALSGRKN